MENHIHNENSNELSIYDRNMLTLSVNMLSITLGIQIRKRHRRNMGQIYVTSF